MGMNPQNMMQMLSAFNTFKNNHPKVVSFVSHFINGGIPEGTIIEMTVTRPGEESVTTNMKVTASDISLFESLKGMKNG